MSLAVLCPFCPFKTACLADWTRHQIRHYKVLSCKLPVVTQRCGRLIVQPTLRRNTFRQRLLRALDDGSRLP